MNSLWLAQRLFQQSLARETAKYLDGLSREPLLATRRHVAQVMERMRQAPGAKVCLGHTMWQEPVEIPFEELIEAHSLITGGTGAGKSMFAALVIEALINCLPDLKGVAFGVLDAKGELFERTLYLLARRLAQLEGQNRETLLQRIVIVDFAEREAISPFNILVRWDYTEPDYFVLSRLETLRELLPAGEKLSLRGANVLKYTLTLLAEFGLPITYLDRVVSSETFCSGLLRRSHNGEVRDYFQRHFPQEAKQTVAALRARMDSLLSSEGVRLALSGSTAPDFRQIQDEGKICLINCAGPAITRGVRLLLQGLVLSDIRQAIFGRPNNPPVSYAWFADEAQNFFLTRQQQENMADIMTMARSFGSFFCLLCQNLSTAVPDARILESLHTNTRWWTVFRSTPHDAAFLKAALPLTGRKKRPQGDPFREAGTYSPEEERTIALSSIAHLADREAWFWPKALSAEAIKIRARDLTLPEGDDFRRVVGAARRNPVLGGRISRADYMRSIAERDRAWLGPPYEIEDLQRQMEQVYRTQAGAQA